MKQGGLVRIGRVYEQPTAEDGRRILVDRLWPRGMRKDDPRIDEWLPEIAPSTSLRKWYGHSPERFSEFCDRYEQELSSDEIAGAALERLTEAARAEQIMITTATREVKTSHLNFLASLVARQRKHT